MVVVNERALPDDQTGRDDNQREAGPLPRRYRPTRDEIRETGDDEMTSSRPLSGSTVITPLLIAPGACHPVLMIMPLGR